MDLDTVSGPAQFTIDTPQDFGDATDLYSNPSIQNVMQDWSVASDANRREVQAPDAEARARRQQDSLLRKDGGDWRRLKLPEGVWIELPANWTLQGDRERRLVEAMTEMFANLPTKGRVGRGATLYGPNGQIIAQLGWRFYSDKASTAITQADVVKMTLADLRKLNANYYDGREIAAAATGERFQARQMPRILKVGSFNGIVTEYRSRYDHEDFERRHIRVRVYDGPLSFSLMINYAAASHSAVRPAIERVLQSLDYSQS